ncbi:hypothetical protein CA236_00095 [Sphingomonas sp. ABOLG]|nr:hypothetical protein CA236_00095 [Sphingomonas sp. ABOLG]
MKTFEGQTAMNISIKNRLERLEAAEPENNVRYRLHFLRNGEPTQRLPALVAHEHLLVVNFVDPALDLRSHSVTSTT